MPAGAVNERVPKQHAFARSVLVEPQVMMDFLKEWEQKLNIKITCSQARRSLLAALPRLLAGTWRLAAGGTLAVDCVRSIAPAAGCRPSAAWQPGCNRHLRAPLSLSFLSGA